MIVLIFYNVQLSKNMAHGPYPIVWRLAVFCTFSLYHSLSFCKMWRHIQQQKFSNSWTRKVDIKVLEEQLLLTFGIPGRVRDNIYPRAKHKTIWLVSYCWKLIYTVICQISDTSALSLELNCLNCFNDEKQTTSSKDNNFWFVLFKLY